MNSLSDGWGSVVVNQSVSGTLSQISSTSIHITNGMTFRATIQGTVPWVYAGSIVIQTEIAVCL